MRMTTVLIVAALCAAACNRIESNRPIPVSPTGQPNTSAPHSATPAPDNSAVNKRDADATTKTPIDQNENQADVDRTAKIRQKILDTKDLSVSARNVKIITADGKVTLRGPVASETERDAILKIAKEVAGEDDIDNQLEVAASPAK